MQVRVSGAASAAISLGALPVGITTSAQFPMQLQSGAASVQFTASSSVAPGSYTISFSGQSGSTAANANISMTVQAGIPPGFSMIAPDAFELALSSGGSVKLALQTFGTGLYDLTFSAQQLPSGTTASFSPSIIFPGGGTTLTITANANAPFSQNAIVNIVAQASAPVPNATLQMPVTVAPKPGNLPIGRTDFVSTEGTPFRATYDASHNLIFASNAWWDRVDVVSSVTHKLLRSVPLSDARGIDMAPDNSKVWVATGTQMVYSIDPVTFVVTQYKLPQIKAYSTFGPQPWGADLIFALADGTLALQIEIGGIGSGVVYLISFDPASGQTQLLQSPPPAQWSYVLKSGNGLRLYSIDGNSGGEDFYYDVMAKTMSGVKTLGGYAVTAAVSPDASRVAIGDLTLGSNLYDGNLNLIGPVPVGGTIFDWSLQGGMIFSPDSKLLYAIMMPSATPVIETIDVQSGNITGVAPAIPYIPVLTELSPSFYMSEPFGVDQTGLIFGIQDFGIAFEDAAFTEQLLQFPGTPKFMQHMQPYSGGLGGGTTSGGFGNAFSILPDVWYGAVRGATTLSSSGTLTITSPPAGAPGPVDVKMMFPDGKLIYDPLFFSYGPQLQYALGSGSSPNGGAPARLIGFGLPIDGSGSLQVGGVAAAITTKPTQYPPIAGSPFPSTFLDYVLPPGQPGWSDVRLATPDGNSTLARAVFYAKSVTDYSSTDVLNAVLYDSARNQIYLSASDHIDVFSLSTGQWLAPLLPKSIGPVKQFQGMAMTSDGAYLLIADLLDGSVAVINPDQPQISFAIPVAAPNTFDPRCTTGPLYVAAAGAGAAVVVTGGAPAIGCGPGGGLYQLDLVTHTASAMQGACGLPNDISYPATHASFISTNHNGNLLAFDGSCVYDLIQKTGTAARIYDTYGSAFSADGNLVGSGYTLEDSAGTAIRKVARNYAYYPQIGSNNGLQNSIEPQPGIPPQLGAQLNDSGSLYFIPYPNFFDVLDTQHATLMMRFSLTEQVQQRATSMAIDAGGKKIFLITDKGLTVVDFGQAPLAVGSLTPSVGMAGAQIIIRGSGFDPTVSATVGGQNAVITFMDELTVRLTLPAANAGPNDLLLTRGDGSQYKLEQAITVQ